MSGVFQSSLWLKHAKSDLRDFMYSWSCNLVSRALLFLTHSMPISFHAESAFPGDKVRYRVRYMAVGFKIAVNVRVRIRLMIFVRTGVSLE